MKPNARITVILPALNEEAAIGGVIAEMPWNFIKECILVDNGSTDSTAAVARGAGARVVSEPRRGYGRALATGIAHAGPQSDVLVFLDGDGSDVPGEIPMIAQPVLDGLYDFVIASRVRGNREPGSLLSSQAFAGWFAGAAMRLLYGARYTDMAPMRAITRAALSQLQMSEMTYGWNLEMQMKAAHRGLRILELPATCRCRRGGISKVAGSFKGSLKAAYRILFVLGRVAIFHR